ncbi:MAG: hypothetical protein AAF497_06260 [Planctomycetota bacterium]
MQKLVFALVVTLFISPCASAVTFTEIARIDVSATASSGTDAFIGNNPSAVAWTGSRLFLGGYNGSGATSDVGIVEVLGADALGFVNEPTYAAAATYAATPTGRGITSLDVSSDGASLAIAYDDGTSSSPAGFAVHNTSDYSLRWFDDRRGSSGASFDPGFEGLDPGTAFGAFGSGRRILYDTQDGYNYYDTLDGMVWFDGGGTLVRDMDFDPNTGDIYVRHNNHVTRARRIGVNEATSDGVISTVDQADFIGFQNLSFLGEVADGDAVFPEITIFNDRSSTGGGQNFVDVMQVLDHLGTQFQPTFQFLDGTAPSTGNGAYDFDYDPVSQTLAISDFANRNVHIFEVGSDGGIAGDFDGSGALDCTDIDALTMEIVSGNSIGTFDLNGDGLVDPTDVTVWLEIAGSLNLPNGNPYLPGDGNLDGVVDVSDFGIWNSSKFTNTAAWCSGDFTADGVVDVSDFGVWNANKFTSSDAASVPEPSGWVLTFGLVVLVGVRGRNKPPAGLSSVYPEPSELRKQPICHTTLSFGTTVYPLRQ